MKAMNMILDPPAIVRSAELTEQQIIKATAQAAARDNWIIGRMAVIWKGTHGRDRTLEDFVGLINAECPDAELTLSHVQKCYRVAKVFGDDWWKRFHFKHVTWSYALLLVGLGEDGAEEWLRKAEDGGWKIKRLVHELKQAGIIIDKSQPATAPRVPTEIRRAVMEAISTACTAIDDDHLHKVLTQHPGYIGEFDRDLEALERKLRKSADDVAKCRKRRTHKATGKRSKRKA